MSVENEVMLAIDLDEVVFDYLGGLRRYMNSVGMPVFDGEPSDFDMVLNGWFADKETFKSIHGEAVEFGLYRDLDVIDGASEVITDLNRSGYQINIVTSRFVNHGQHSIVAGQTAESLDKNKIPYSNILFLNNKSRFLANSYIDDAPHNLQPLIDLNRHVVVFDRRYNKSVSGGDRCSNWPEIREALYRRYNM